MTSITQGLIHRGTIISVGWRNTIIKSVTNNSSRTRTLCQILCDMFNIRIISFILHNNLRKLMFWEVKQFAQDHTVSDREGRSCMSVWPKSLCAGSAWYCSHRGNSWHSIYSVRWPFCDLGLLYLALASLPQVAWSNCLLWEHSKKKPLPGQKLFLSTAFLSRHGAHGRYFPKKKARGITFQSECGKKTKTTT